MSRNGPFAILFHTLFVVFMLAPLVVVCLVAFTPEGYLSLPGRVWSLRWFKAILDYPEFLRAFRDSLWLAALSSTVAIGLAVPAALAIASSRFPGREAMTALFMSPLMVPHVVPVSYTHLDVYKRQVYKDVAPVMKFKSNKGVGLGLVGTGLFYNKKVFDENKWPAPTSWNDLKSKTYGKKIVSPPINNTYGLHALIAFAQIGGGGENNIEPGFDAFKKDINPNIVAYEPSPAKMTELFQNCLLYTSRCV